MVNKTHKLKAELKDHVIVTVSKDWEQAKDYESMLKAHNISAILQAQDEPSTSNQGFAVMVPKDCLEEAQVVIESQNVEDEFYDSLFENEDEEFDSEYFDDVFYSRVKAYR